MRAGSASAVASLVALTAGPVHPAWAQLCAVHFHLAGGDARRGRLYSLPRPHRHCGAGTPQQRVSGRCCRLIGPVCAAPRQLDVGIPRGMLALLFWDDAMPQSMGRDGSCSAVRDAMVCMSFHTRSFRSCAGLSTWRLVSWVLAAASWSYRQRRQPWAPDAACTVQACPLPTVTTHRSSLSAQAQVAEKREGDGC